ncbi:MAG: response regulator [Cyanobacteria bacterium P01_F01_bin.86]
MSKVKRREQREKPKLLVVDDEPDNLDLLYRTFYRDFKVLRAESGHAALGILEEQPDVAVIISDQRMPGMSGTEFLRQTAVKHPNIIRIILTGYTDVENLVDAINEGKVFKYVTKPWEGEELQAVVMQALETHQVLRSRTEELQRILQQESLLNAITDTIRRATNSQEMRQTIVETVGTLMGADICVLQPYDGAMAADYSRYVSSDRDITPETLQQWESLLVWQVAEVTSLTPEIMADMPDLTAQLAAYQSLDIQSTLLVPLMAQQRLMAVLALHHCGIPRNWHSSEMQLLVTTADQAALAMSQAITYEQVQALARREHLLNTVTQAIRSSLEPQAIFAAITQELGQALKVDSCVLSLWTAADKYVQCVGLYEGTNDAATTHSLTDNGLTATDEPDLPQSQVPISSNPVLQQLLDTQQLIAIHDLSEHPEMWVQDQPLHSKARSLLVVPLLTDGQIIGSISLRHIHQPHTWSNDEMALVQAVAVQAAIAVQQSRLYQTTREQAEQLMALDRQKTEFFQNISHEFRTPLTLTLGPLEAVVAQGQGLDYEQSTVALRNARRLLRLVNQLLDLQRLDAGRMQPTFRPVTPETFVDEVVTAFRPYCDRKGLQLEAKLAPCPVLYLDLEKFDKVLYNLLSNAVKFTAAGGQITVTLASDTDQCILTVQDTGIGIREDQLPQLFQRFQQADGSTNRQYEGTGLGLALVKELVALHHGTIAVESVYGAGTTFRVTLPTGRTHLPDEQIMDYSARAETSRAAVELADILTTEDTWNSPPAEAPAELEATAHYILVVDDNSDLRAYISNVLQRQDYQVRTAHHAEAALEMMQTHTPDLILTDLMMPGMSGVELLQHIRQDDRLRSIPVVLLTAKVDDETRIEGVEQGADAYLGKPFNDRELLAEVRNLLALKANERRVAELNQYLTESVLRRFLPDSLVSKAAAGELQLDLKPEPRVITVLFADIVGFTPLSNQLGARRIAQLLNDYLAAITDTIFANGGTVDKFMGDGVMALFGAPEDLPSAEQINRALTAVNQMHIALADLNQRWQGQGIQPLRVRCGLHQGDAVVGMFGGNARSDYTAIGPCVNIASRLQEVAEPNGLLVSWELAQHLPPDLIVDTQEIILRGLNVPMRACHIRLNLPS